MLRGPLVDMGLLASTRSPARNALTAAATNRLEGPVTVTGEAAARIEVRLVSGRWISTVPSALSATGA